MTSFDVNAPSMTIMNLVTDDVLEPQFNPTELSERYAATYGELVVPGLSHKRRHFSNTENPKFGPLSLYFSCVNMGPEGLEYLNAARLALIASVHPWRSDSIERGGPPRMLFAWPQLLSLVVTVDEVSIVHQAFNRRGASVSFTASVTVTEVRDKLVSMEDILRQGTYRPMGRGA